MASPQVGVRLQRSPLLLTVDAIREALTEAGLSIGQIDGVSTYPGRSSAYLGFSPIGADELIDALGIRARWHLGSLEISSQLGAVAAAAMAVRTGQARHVICFRTVYEAAAMSRPEEYPPLRRDRVDGYSQWLTPFNAYSAANWTAQYAMRHVKRFGLTREQLAQIALTDRANALLNPRALVREPLTMEQYLSARMISTPLCLYDCDRYTDASTVLIVSAGDALDEVECTPIRIAAMAGTVERHSWDQAEWMACYPTGADLWKSTDYKPADVDTVQLYDGFSFQAIAWLEGSAFVQSAKAADSSKEENASRSTASCPSTPSAASSARVVCMGLASLTKPCCSCGDSAASARSRAILRWRSPRRAADLSQPPCCWRGIDAGVNEPHRGLTGLPTAPAGDAVERMRALRARGRLSLHGGDRASRRARRDGG